MKRWGTINYPVLTSVWPEGFVSSAQVKSVGKAAVKSEREREKKKKKRAQAKT